MFIYISIDNKIAKIRNGKFDFMGPLIISVIIIEFLVDGLFSYWERCIHVLEHRQTAHVNMKTEISLQCPSQPVFYSFFYF